jgi:uncharacterized protein YhfF
VSTCAAVAIVTGVEGDRHIDAFWARFVAATGIDGEYTAWAFGDSAVQMTELALLVREGRKRATASAHSAYEEEGAPLPEVGELSVILDGADDPVCVIRTTQVDVRAFGAVDDDFAAAEGEGDGSLDYWRSEHRRFFEGQGIHIDDDTLVVLQWFELLYTEPQADSRSAR